MAGFIPPGSIRFPGIRPASTRIDPGGARTTGLSCAPAIPGAAAASRDSGAPRPPRRAPGTGLRPRGTPEGTRGLNEPFTPALPSFTDPGLHFGVAGDAIVTAAGGRHVAPGSEAQGGRPRSRLPSRTGQRFPAPPRDPPGSPSDGLQRGVRDLFERPLAALASGRG